MAAVPSGSRVKLRTTSRRVPRARAADAAVDDAPEPTMRLSRAILVMLMLHVVAVGGFFASSVLKEHDLKRSPADPSAALEAEDSPLPASGEHASATKHPPLRDNARPSVHVVRPGETLTLIANENGVTLEALVAANGAETVTNGLRTGQELKLPERSPDPTAQTTANSADALNLIEGHTKPLGSAVVGGSSPGVKSNRPPQDAGKFYVVEKGENAYTIALKNKVSYEALLKANQITDPKKLRPGQKLRLPLPTGKKKLE